MNAQLRAQRARYDSLRSTIAATQAAAEQDNRDLSADELRSVNEAADEAQALLPEIERLTETEQRNRRIDELALTVHEAAYGGGSVNVGTGQPSGHVGPDERVPGLMPSRSQVNEMWRSLDEQTARRWTVDGGEQYRTAVDSVNAGAASVNLATGAVSLGEPRRISTAAGLVVERVQGVSGLSFPVFGDGAADIVAEGSAKPEYDAVTADVATPMMISTWTDASRQALLSVLNFEQRLRAKHAAMIARREDELLCARVQAATGTQSYTATAGSGESYADSLLAAAALVLDSDVAAAPDVAVINSADLIKVFPGASGSNGEQPTSNMRLDLHGMAIYVSGAVTAGSAIVGAWRASASFVLGLAPTTLVDSVSQLKNNLVTILSEEAATLGVHEPSGFVEVSFDTGA